MQTHGQHCIGGSCQSLRPGGSYIEHPVSPNTAPHGGKVYTATALIRKQVQQSNVAMCFNARAGTAMEKVPMRYAE